jgi:hypothetical protein
MDELRFGDHSVAIPAPLHPVEDLHRDEPDCDDLTGHRDGRHRFSDLISPFQDDVLHCLGRNSNHFVRLPYHWDSEEATTSS